MKKQRGMALLMVLLMMSLMAAVAVSINGYWQRALARTQFQQEQLQAKWLLLGAEAYAKSRLQQARDAQSAWALPDEALRMRTPEGEVAIRFRRPGACFNVNALIRAAAADAATDREKQIFMLLLDNLGIAAPQAGAIADAIVEKAYEDGYLMGDISELRPLEGIDRELYLRLAPQLCAEPDAALRMNLNAVSAHQLPLLRAMLMNALSVERLQALFAARPPQGWRSLDVFAKEKEWQALSEGELSERLILDDNRGIAELQVTLNGSRYRLTSALQLGGAGVTVNGRQFSREAR